MDSTTEVVENEVKEKENINDAAEMVEVVDETEFKYGNPEKAVKKVPKSKLPKEEKKEEKKVEDTIIVEEKKDEPKKDEKIVVDEIKDEKKKDDKKEFFDVLDKPEVKKDEKKPEDKVAEKSLEDFKKEINFPEFEKKAKMWEAIESSPVAKILLEAQELGKPFEEVLNELRSTDYSKLDYSGATDEQKELYDREIARAYYSSKGLKDEALANEVEEFVQDGESRAKRRDREDFIAHLNHLQETKVQKYLSGLQDEKEQIKNRQSAFQADVDKSIQTVKERGNLYGMQLTDEQISKFGDGMKGFFNRVWNEDGTVNMPFVQASVFFADFGRQKLKDVAEKSFSDGQHKVLEAVIKPDAEVNASQLKQPDKPFDRETANEERFGGKSN